MRNESKLKTNKISIPSTTRTGTAVSSAIDDELPLIRSGSWFEQWLESPGKRFLNSERRQVVRQSSRTFNTNWRISITATYKYGFRRCHTHPHFDADYKAIIAILLPVLILWQLNSCIGKITKLILLQFNQRKRKNSIEGLLTSFRQHHTLRQLSIEQQQLKSVRAQNLASFLYCEITHKCLNSVYKWRNDQASAKLT